MSSGIRNDPRRNRKLTPKKQRALREPDSWHLSHSVSKEEDMTATLMQRVGTVVAAMLVAGHPVMAGGAEPEMRSDLTLGGQPLAQLLRVEPILSSAAVQASLLRLNASADAPGLQVHRANAVTSGNARIPTRRAGGLDWCRNRRGSGCMGRRCDEVVVREREQRPQHLLGRRSRVYRSICACGLRDRQGCQRDTSRQGFGARRPTSQATTPCRSGDIGVTYPPAVRVATSAGKYSLRATGPSSW